MSKDSKHMLDSSEARNSKIPAQIFKNELTHQGTSSLQMSVSPSKSKKSFKSRQRTKSSKLYSSQSMTNPFIHASAGSSLPAMLTSKKRSVVSTRLEPEQISLASDENGMKSMSPIKDTNSDDE